MNWFRLYFLNETGRIAAREEFQAEDDQRAITITSLLFDACSDRSPDKRDALQAAIKAMAPDAEVRKLGRRRLFERTDAAGLSTRG